MSMPQEPMMPPGVGGGPPQIPMGPGGGQMDPGQEQALLAAIVQMLMARQGEGAPGQPPVPPMESLPPGMIPQGGPPAGVAPPGMPGAPGAPSPGGEGPPLTPQMIEMLLSSGPGNALAPMPQGGPGVPPGLMDTLAARGRGGPR